MKIPTIACMLFALLLRAEGAAGSDPTPPQSPFQEQAAAGRLSYPAAYGSRWTTGPDEGNRSHGSGATLADRGAVRSLSVAPALTGQLLVASQRLADPNFARSVIYLIAHGPEGAMGVIINRIFGTISFRNLLSPLGIKTSSNKVVNVYLGGPVEIGRGLILHSPDYTGASTQQLGHSVAVSTGPDVLKALAEGKGPKQSRIMLGYAGWGPGQMDHEMARGDWLVAPADPSLIFSSDPETIWDKAFRHAGINL